ncbi:MAG TPA: isoamylase [Acidobacteriota bacterium]|nr:isoamylase [Acidobacteriota bacterium]
MSTDIPLRRVIRWFLTSSLLSLVFLTTAVFLPTGQAYVAPQELPQSQIQVTTSDEPVVPEGDIALESDDLTARGTFQGNAINRNNLGARYDATKANITFRVFSSRATRIEVCIFKNATGSNESVRYVMTKDAATNVWSKTASVATLKNSYGITGTVYYGFRAWGPNWTYVSTWTPGSSTGFVSDVDASGNRFNPNKLLLDPYALEMSHDPTTPTNTDGTIYASGATYRNINSGPKAPKGIVLSLDTTSFGTKPTRALKDDIVYEVHVRGLTKNDPSIPAAYQGTYKGAALKAQALADLGITAVEFLPVQETQNDTNDVNPTTTAGDNYWGYMTLNYFAPDRRYSSDKTPGGPTREFKEMVKAFHDRGIKVFIDVVYNHTGEGGAWNGNDPTVFNVMSWRGLDNPTYYCLTSDKQFSWDNTGVGGNYNTFNPVAQDMIVDSLAYWRDTIGLDGYRFDLASVLGNTCEHGCFNYDKLNSGTALNRIARELTPRPAGGGAGVDLIAEPWAIGGNSYQVGNFPSGWSEWNGIYRDVIRKDQNQMGLESVTPGQLATRFAGSSDLYADDGRKPWNSVNFIVAHDGFTLKDLYSYNSKVNNQAWPYGPSDGGEDNNHSWDQAGWAHDQRKAARNGLALMMLNAGVPMITGGDEFLRTQFGNNNAYNLDSNANWLNYTLSTDQQNFKAFTQGMMAFRKAHPALRPANFYASNDTNGNVMEQMRWFRPDGGVADGAYMDNANNHCLAYRVDGTEFGDSASAIYVAYNGWSGDVNFTLPWPGAGKNWYRVTDTSVWAEGATQVRTPGAEDFIGGEYYQYSLKARGILVLIAK